LILRRVLSLSLLGRIEEALVECDLALQIVPYVPATLLYRGFLCSKLGMTAQANTAFKKCVVQDPDLRDITELVVAMFFQAKRHNDRAIQIATQVLARTPGSAFAMVVRGTALKYHAKGCYHVDATDDFAHAMTRDKAVQPLLGPNFGFDDLARFDKMLLAFHPWLRDRSPLPLFERRLPFWVLRGRSWFGFVSLLFMFLGKLKRKVRLRQRTVQFQRQEALFRAQNDAVTDRMRGLLAAGYDAEKWQRERDVYFRRKGRSKSAKASSGRYSSRPAGTRAWLPAGQSQETPYVPLCTPSNEDLVGVFRSRGSQSGVGEACWRGMKARSSQGTMKSPRDSNLISHFPPDLVVDFLASETRGARHVPDVVKACEVEPVWQWHRDGAASTVPASPHRLPSLEPRSPRMRSVLDTKDFMQERANGTKCMQPVDSPWRVCGPEDSKPMDPSARLPAPRISGSAYQEQHVEKTGFLPMAQLETLDITDPAEENWPANWPTSWPGWGSRPGDALCFNPS